MISSQLAVRFSGVEAALKASGHGTGASGLTVAKIIRTSWISIDPASSQQGVSIAMQANSGVQVAANSTDTPRYPVPEP
ncbi:hypothetical protein IWQ52_002693 [Labrenzia sp. EL_159]|nr:hypothetical protein [Labrenzia sp. EL_162]MBG6195170.1 hypothetical protein [Labrenzia sp. EL_159]